MNYAKAIVTELRANFVRVDADYSMNKINGKIQDAEKSKVHTMLVIGGRDLEAGNVSVRLHGKGNLGAKPKAEVVVEEPMAVDPEYAVVSIAVDHEACILCDRCIRGCDEIRHNDVLGRRGKGFMAGIAFDTNLPMGNSSCVSCGECMVSCPTGALTNKSVVKTVLPGEPMDVEELQQLDYFKKVSGTFLELNKNAVVRRHYRHGGL